MGRKQSDYDTSGEIFNVYEGREANTAGEYSHAEGHRTKASGSRSHAEGETTVASGQYSHAEGCETVASGMASHVEGNRNNASGRFSHAEGSLTNASGEGSHAEGKFTQALTECEHAEGFYNKSYDSVDASIRVIHSVGIGGSSREDRKNAHEIKFNGDHYIYGLGNFDGTNSADAQTLQEVINSLFNITVDLREYDTVMSNDGGGFKIADLSDQHYINGADIFIKDNNIEGAIKYFVVEKNENMAKTIDFSNGTTFEYTQEYELKRNEVESVKVYARYGKYSTEEESKWWLMRVIPAGGGSN